MRACVHVGVCVYVGGHTCVNLRVCMRVEMNICLCECTLAYECASTCGGVVT
jgi:hypothetical protein